jgi:hypothetical protein
MPSFSTRQTDGRTGGLANMTKLTVAFCNFANALKNEKLHDRFYFDQLYENLYNIRDRVYES